MSKNTGHIRCSYHISSCSVARKNWIHSIIRCWPHPIIDWLCLFWTHSNSTNLEPILTTPKLINSDRLLDYSNPKIPSQLIPISRVDRASVAGCNFSSLLGCWDLSGCRAAETDGVHRAQAAADTTTSTEGHLLRGGEPSLGVDLKTLVAALIRITVSKDKDPHLRQKQSSSELINQETSYIYIYVYTSYYCRLTWTFNQHNPTEVIQESFLIIDEAAGFPVNFTSELLEAAGRVLLATTLDGSLDIGGTPSVELGMKNCSMV